MARAFNGFNQYLTTASSPASGSPMTIALWGNRRGGRAFISVGVANAQQRNQIQSDDGGGLQFVANGSLAEQVTSSVALPVGWNHLCGVFTSSTSREGFLNGASVATGTVNIGTQNTATRITIGARDNTSIGNFINADIAEIGIWSAALTAAEIASLSKGMTCDKIRPQNLVFYAPIVRDLIDQKNGLAITNNGGATVAAHPRIYP